ncbi:MAG: L-seryl-tRNA(Sec) selenium transferase [Chloroflexi bacterium]|nr:L-seryl-tRNA(Sec) selenium transferase [Chloroflexota bacterium]
MRALAERYSREAVTDLVRQVIDEARQTVSGGGEAPSAETLAERVESKAKAMWQSGPRPVINATGVIIHTNLGRAPLSREALEAILQAARGYSNLEYDLEDGERGSRQAHIRHLLAQLTGAEDALVVNNNASAVLLALAALAQGREVIVSRAEAVEIGGGFRIPDVMRQSGATLVEVGTTNRTYISDYAEAITPNTAALLKVHASNFRISGFTHAPELSELVELGKVHALPVIYDLGSGCLLDTVRFGLAHEPMPQEAMAAGVSLTMFSGDKLLGGPQAGLLMGQKELVQRLSRHPLARSVRIDKLSLAALSATLLHYVKDEAVEKVPVWRMVAAMEKDLKAKARRWAALIGPPAMILKGESTIGGGSLPGEVLPTWLLAIPCTDLPVGAEGLAASLRASTPPVVARILDERLVLDPRTVLPEEEKILVQAVKGALS